MIKNNMTASDFRKIAFDKNSSYDHKIDGIIDSILKDIYRWSKDGNLSAKVNMLQHMIDIPVHKQFDICDKIIVVLRNKGFDCFLHAVNDPFVYEISW